MKIAIFCRTNNERSTQVVRDLMGILKGNGIDILVSEHIDLHFRSMHEPLNVSGTFNESSKHLTPDVSYMISVGGDGAFLNAIEYVHDAGIPVVGINIGRLGFLAHITEADLRESVEKLLAGELPVEERPLLQVKVEGERFRNFPYALNDMVIQKNGSGLITIHTWSNGEFLNSYWADGLIVATPTGSSAYSLSVGGPIVAPESRNFIISPIAAHNLNVRPLVIPDNAVLKLKTECRGNDQKFTMSLDSRSFDFISGTGIELRRSDFTVKIVKSASFYTTLRNKLMWGVDKRN